MQGHYLKRGSTWSYIIDHGVNPQTGKRKQKMKGGFKTKKDAQLAAAEFQKEKSDGIYIDESDITFEDFAKEWLEFYQESVKISTVRVRKHEIGHLNQHFAKVKMRDITKRAYQNTLVKLKKTYAKSTVDGIHGTAQMIFKQAKAFDLIKVNPTEYARPPRTKKTVEDIEQRNVVPKYLEKEELALFIKTANEKGLDGDYEVFLTLAYTGLRAGELCALKKTDLNSDLNTISITKTYYNPTNSITAYELLPPKTETSIRVIEVDPLVTKTLEKFIAKQNPIIMKHRKTYHNKGFIFTNSKYPGYPIYIKIIENRMKRLLKIAGLSESLTPHSLRHTHTSLLAEAKVGLEEIMERLGHTDDDTTRKVYLHVTKDMKKEAAQKFTQLMRGL